LYALLFGLLGNKYRYLLKDRPTKWEFPELPYPIGVVFSLRKLTLHMLYIGLRNVYQHHASITEYVEEVRKCRLLAPYILLRLSSGVVVCLIVWTKFRSGCLPCLLGYMFTKSDYA